MSEPEARRSLTRSRGATGLAPDRVRDRPRKLDGVRMLRGSGLPRVMWWHLGPEHAAYLRYLKPLLEFLGLFPLPEYAVEAARQAGLAALTLWRLQSDLEELRQRRGPGRRRQAEQRLEARIRKQLVAKRLCEQDLARLAQREQAPALVEDLRARFAVKP